MAAEINTSSPLMMLYSAMTSGAFILFGKLITYYQNIHLPPVFIESLQVLSYLGAFTVSCLTLYKFCNERKKNSKHDKSTKV